MLILNLVAKDQVIGVVTANGVVVGFEIGLDDFGVHHCLIGKSLAGIFGSIPSLNWSRTQRAR